MSVLPDLPCSAQFSRDGTKGAGRREAPAQGVVEGPLQTSGVDCPGQVEERASHRGHRDGVADTHVRRRKHLGTVDEG